MNAVDVQHVSDPTLRNPVLIEGLPGVGLVGTLAVDHLLAECECEPVRRLYSEHFPPAVSVNDAGDASLPSLSIDAVSVEDRDLLVLSGQTQAQDSVGQYRCAEAVLDVAQDFGVETVIGIGGYGTGETIEEYAVVGATGIDEREGGTVEETTETDEDTARTASSSLTARLRDAGVEFEREEAPEQVVGMSGLLVGLGARRGFETASLLGLTPGYHVDPGSARAVLEALQEAFDFTVSLESLDEQAEEVQQLLEQVQEVTQAEQETPAQGREDLRYFG